VERWREAGTLMCINAGSLWGEYGSEAERLSRRMLAAGHVDLIASDHHARPQRATTVRQAWDLLTEAGFEEQARLLLAENPGAVVEGRDTQQVAPCEISESWVGRLRRLVRGG
jgi:protein-tyrosine phosphatase